jgi:hypothetical protein
MAEKKEEKTAEESREAVGERSQEKTKSSRTRSASTP